MHVPMLDLAAQYATLRDEIEPRLLEVCASQRFVLGPEVEAFEAEIAAYCGARHAIGCASGTDALTLALMALDVGPGDEVVTPSFTFVASVEAIALRGATPVFADIDPATFNVDPAAVAAVLGPRTRAIIAVDLFGQCAELQALADLAAHHDLPLIEDAAQSLGAEHRGRRAGSLATITTFSFYPSKNLGGFGDGGMLTTQDDRLAERLRQLRVHGESQRYHHERVGTNSRLDALQAAVLRVKLGHLDAWTQARQQCAARYDDLLHDADLTDRVQPPAVAASATRHVFNQYTVRVPQRAAVQDHLTARGVGSAVYYPVPQHRQAAYREFGGARVDLRHTEQAASEVLSLPIYPELTPAQQAYVVEQLRAFFTA